MNNIEKTETAINSCLTDITRVKVEKVLDSHLAYVNIGGPFPCIGAYDLKHAADAAGATSAEIINITTIGKDNLFVCITFRFAQKD